MTELENELIKYHYARADIYRLEDQLKHALDRLYDQYIPPNMAVNPQLARVQKSHVGSSVERAVIMICVELAQDIETIQQQIQTKRRVMGSILNMIQAARLTGPEEEYVRLRYMENNRPDKLPGLMHYEKRALEYMRESALDKLRGAYSAFGLADDKIYGEDNKTA